MCMGERGVQINMDGAHISSNDSRYRLVVDRKRLSISGFGIGVLIINFNTACQTLRCLESLRKSSIEPDWVFVLDNASQSEDYEILLQGCRNIEMQGLRLYKSNSNYGFAQGSNLLIDLLLEDQRCEQVVLLNNDAVACKEMLRMLADALKHGGKNVGLAGGRMHRLAAPEQVDTLGISIYMSLMPADRKVLEDLYVGPTGGCCIFSRDLLARLKNVYGYYFDSRFFCYCEDTDLALRAILVGYRAVYIDQIIAYHEGQASSGGGSNQFIAYHGLRNTLWMHVKLMPSKILLKYGVFLILAHLMTVVRYVLSGRWRLVWRVYRDAFKCFPEYLAERKNLRALFIENGDFLASRLTARFYRKGYFHQMLASNWGGRKEKSGFK